MGILNILKALSKGLIKENAAAKKITELGYPESVAKRIASGKLPMDEASRMARAKAQGRVDAYHATKQDFNEFKAGYSDDMAFTTPDTEFANNWLGKGKYQERIGAEDEIHGLRKKQRDIRASFFDYDELDKLSKQGKDAEWKAAYDRMQQNYKDAVKNDVAPDRVYDTIYPMMPKAEKTFDPRTDYKKILPVLEKSVGNLSDDTIKSLKRGDYLWYESKDVADWLRANGYDSILLSESGGDITTLASLYPKTMRSKFAAFDDEYTGSNILGSVAPLAVGTTATAITGGLLSNQAEAAPFKKIGDIAKGLLGSIKTQGEQLPTGLLANPKMMQSLQPITKKAQADNVKRAYRGGSDRMWTETGEMSTTGGKQKTSDIGAWSSSNPGTGESYAKPIGFGGAEKTGQVAPVDITMDTVATVEHPNRLTQIWSDLPKEMVVTLPDGKKMTIGEMYPNANRKITTDDVARTIKQNFPETGGVRFKSLIDAGPHDWDPKGLLHPTEKRGASQDSYAIWDESIMKGAYAKGEKPGYMNGMIMPVAGGGSATIMGDDAEAAVIPPTITELFKLGLLKPEMMNSARGIKNAEAEFYALMRKPGYRDMVEKARNVDFNSTYIPKTVEQQIIKPEDLAGHALLGYKSDRTDLGRVTNFLGTEVDMPVQSGTKFTAGNKDSEMGWLSMGSDVDMSGTANKAHKKAIDTADIAEAPVAAASTLMGETSSRFNTNVAELMLSRIKDNMPSKKVVEAFDKEMRKTDPDWVGLDSENALAQLKGQGDFSMDGAGAHRHRFLQVLEQPNFRKAGMPQPNTALQVIDNPEFADVPIGAQGMNIWLPDVERSVVAMPGLHDTYSHGMPRVVEGLMGRYEVPISFQAQNPKIWRELQTHVDKNQNPLAELQKLNKSMDSATTKDRNYTYQMMDQEAIDSANKAIEHNKGLLEKYGTFGAALLKGEAFAEPAVEFNTQPQQDEFDRLVSQVTKRQPQPAEQQPIDEFDRLLQRARADREYMMQPEREQIADFLKKDTELTKISNERNALGAQLRQLGQGGQGTDQIINRLQQLADQEDVINPQAPQFRAERNPMLGAASRFVGRANDRSMMPMFAGTENMLGSMAMGQSPDPMDELFAGLETGGGYGVAKEVAKTGGKGILAPVTAASMLISLASEGAATLFGMNEEQRREKQIEELRRVGLLQ